jgi:NAD(P)-dependent dehydrogenase (short-subunit alcohol dehydrogenase family)
MRLDNKVAVVTGAAQGIGRACAERMAVEGARVVLSDVNREKGEVAAEAIRDGGGDACFIACDVREKAQIETLVAETVRAYGRLDCAVANAGIVSFSDFLDITEEDFDNVMQVNLRGVFLTGQAVARQMANQGTGGAIVNMSSINAILAIPNIVPYNVAKGGVNQLTRSMAVALADNQIRVNAIGPGSTMTELMQSVAKDEEGMRRIRARTPLGRPGEPGEIAKVAVFLASDDSSYMTGQTVYVDGGRMALHYTMPDRE